MIRKVTKDGSGTNGYQRAYLYGYDQVDRYTSADYYERPTGSGAYTNSHGWDEDVTGYDNNGNIMYLNRNASTAGVTGTAIDNLTYTYKSTNANQLDQVTDATHIQTGFGIYSGGDIAGHYVYDPNGNLTSDPFKDMGFTYNVLNRADVITMPNTTGRNIAYIYDAGGNMIRKVATAATGGAVTTTDYIGGFVYVNGTLSYFPMPEGRIVNNSGNLTPEYVITDQQGNARITFNNTGTGNGAKVIQENSYYGFGMVMPGSAVSTTPTPPNNNLYNGGSELQNDFSDLPNLMQTFYRNYDAVLGRWTGVDPQADGIESMSSYQYAGNNPIMGNDPLGNKINPNPPGPDNSNHFYWGDVLWNEGLAQNEADFQQWLQDNPGPSDIIDWGNDFLQNGGSYAHVSSDGKVSILNSNIVAEPLMKTPAGLVIDFFPIIYGKGAFAGAIGMQVNIGVIGAAPNDESYNWLQVYSKSELDDDGEYHVDDQDSNSDHYPFYYSNSQVSAFSPFMYTTDGIITKNTTYNSTTFSAFFTDGPAVKAGSFDAEVTLVSVDSRGIIAPLFSMNYQFSLTGNSQIPIEYYTPSISQPNALTQQIILIHNIVQQINGPK